MKQKKMIFTLLTAALTATVFVACSSAEATKETKKAETIAVEEVKTEVAEVKEANPTPEPTTEPTPAPTDTQKEILVKEDIDVNSKLPGEEWITSIGNDIKDPFIAIWNDVEGTKRILENEEEYQLKENDVFFLYFPRFTSCDWMEPKGITNGVVDLDNGRIIEFDKSVMEEETLIKFIIGSPGLGYSAELSCTLTK